MNAKVQGRYRQEAAKDETVFCLSFLVLLFVVPLVCSTTAARAATHRVIFDLRLV
jgi:hypothetical protein